LHASNTEGLHRTNAQSIFSQTVTMHWSLNPSDAFCFVDERTDGDHRSAVW